MTLANKKTLIISVLFVCWFFFSAFSSPNKQASLNQRGNEQYAEGDLEGALTYYTKALSSSNDQSRDLLHMNIGNVFYKMGEHDKAIAEYMLAKSLSDDDLIKADAFYNIGNTLFTRQEYNKAVQAYIEALKLNPLDNDAKHNLELALNMLEDEESQDNEKDEQEQDSDNEKKDSQEQDESRNEDDSAEQEEDPMQDQDREDQAERDNDSDSEQPETELDLDMQEMQRLLEMMEDEDRDTQEERIRSAILKDFPQEMDDVEKDW